MIDVSEHTAGMFYVSQIKDYVERMERALREQEILIGNLSEESDRWHSIAIGFAGLVHEDEDYAYCRRLVDEAYENRLSIERSVDA